MSFLEPIFITLIKDIEEIDNCFNTNLTNKGFNNDFFASEENHDIIRNCNELTFIYVIAFLYKLYVERGKSNIKYLIKKFNIFNIDKNDCEMHLKVVHDFRTFLFHFLDVSQSHNKSIKQRSQLWFLGETGKNTPKTEEDWGKCVLAILKDAKKFLETLKTCLYKIVELNDSSLIDEWLTYIKKDLPKYKIRQIFIEIITKYELSLDADVFLEKNYNKIKERVCLLDLEQMEYIEHNTKLIIENFIFQPGNVTCPLSGDDIEKAFGATGKQIGEFKRRAIKIFNFNIYLTKEQIIEQLKIE